MIADEVLRHLSNVNSDESEDFFHYTMKPTFEQFVKGPAVLDGRCVKRGQNREIQIKSTQSNNKLILSLLSQRARTTHVS